MTVAVLDTGVAYATRGGSLKSPDLDPRQFVRGWDFVSHDAYATDANGHGTMIASVIAEATDNAVGLAGLAYGVQIMPIRVLNDRGQGNEATIARGIRWAVRHGAEVINLSVDFPNEVTARSLPTLVGALGYAYAKGVFIAASAGNQGRTRVAYPARSRYTTSVGATTEHGCASASSNYGRGLDLVAPGGGADAVISHDPNCRPTDAPGRHILQVTLTGADRRHFGLASSYDGTSAAAAHVAAAAALVIASAVLGRHPTPSQIQQRLEHTARDLGAPGRDARYGGGLIDAGAATTPSLAGDPGRA